MSNSNNKKTLPSWILWVIILAAVAIGIYAIYKGSGEGKDSDSKATTEKVIVLKPGQTIPLEINDKEWSPWIDASKVYSYPHTDGYGLKQLFANGESITIRPGEGKKLIPNKKGYSVYRLKTPPGVGTAKAIIQASSKPINKELYK